MTSDAPAAHHPEHSHGEDPSHGTLKSYLTGFGLAVVLTVIPFALVMGHVFSSAVLTEVLVLFIGLVQIVVHMIYFLHLDTKSEGGWNMLALIFTAILVVIALAGSLWVMFHLNGNMMPGMMKGDMTQM